VGRGGGWGVGGLGGGVGGGGGGGLSCGGKHIIIASPPTTNPTP